MKTAEDLKKLLASAAPKLQDRLCKQTEPEKIYKSHFLKRHEWVKLGELDIGENPTLGECFIQAYECKLCGKMKRELG